MSDPETSFYAVGETFMDAEASQMFGKKCFKVGGKAFTSFFQDCMVFKLTGEHHSAALEIEGATLFDPSGKGRPMKEWVQVPFEAHDQWAGLADAARIYVLSKA
ncbi:hypothetical protein [Maritalea sp.]|uniref:hypothetical protein n=1 Tax=Maritalea sp. TaxID=2003361 RepID=UPI003EF91D8A